MRIITRDSIPRLYAAASLKLGVAASAASEDVGIPRLYAAASLKPTAPRTLPVLRPARIPRLYAAASLKRG